MRRIAQLSEGADRQTTVAAAKRESKLTDAELDRITAAGGAATGGHGGNAEWPPPPARN
jgi:hypothetical protein